MIQFDRIRKSSLLRDKVYYLCNQIKFYSIKDPLVTAFYFLTQSLALISTFIASPLAQATSTASILTTINSLFFFYSNDFYLSHDSQLALSHLVSLFLFLCFAFIAYFTYSLDHCNHLVIRKTDLKKIRMVEMLVFFLVTFSIPLGSFMWYYIIRLFQMSMEYLALLSLINLICIFSLVYVVEQCSIESDLKNYKSLSRLYSKNESIHSIVKMMVRMIIASFNNLTDSVIILSLLALLIFDLYQLRVSIITKKFLNSITESLYYYKNVSTVILELLMLFCLLTSFPLIVNNFFLSVISTSLLAYLALRQFKQNKKINLILDGLDSVTSEDDAKIYMLEMISMLDTSQNREEIFTLSLITIHKEKCRAETCFCRNFNFQGFNKLMDKGEFLRRFVLSKLQGVVEKFSSSFLILSILLNYKLSIMSSFSKIYYLLKSYTQKNEQALQSFSQQYMLYQVEIIIQKEIHKNNAERFVEVEKTFKEDNLKTQLTGLLLEANNAFTEKYKLLAQEICNLNLIDNLCLKISNILRAIEAIWKEFSKKDSYNLKIYEIFLVYFEYIVFSKKQAALMKTTIIRKTQALQHLKGISEQNMERYLYTDKSCVIEAVFNKDKVGIVTNISLSCQQVFKCNRDQILQKDIHELMPEYFVNEHRRWTQQWLDNEVLTGKILGLIKSYFVDSSGNTFSCSLHMKVASTGFKLKFYIMIIKDNSSDYLLLNNALEIQGIGSKLEIQQVFEMCSLKKSIKEYSETDIREITDEIIEGEPVKKRLIFRNQSNLNFTQKQMGFAILGACSEVYMKQPPQAYIYQCEVLFQRHVVNRFNYFTLRFFEIRKLIKHNSGFLFKTIIGSKNYEYYPSSNGGSKNNCKLDAYEPINHRSNQVESDNMLKESQSECKSEDENKFEIHNMSSVAESAMGEGNIIFSKLAEQIKEKSVNHSKITDRRLNATTLIILVMIGVVAGSAFLQSYLFSTGMNSYNEIIFATSAVSKNHQLMEAIFNYAINLNYYCSNSSEAGRCSEVFQKSHELTKRVYGDLVNSVQVYLLNTTSLTGIRYYSYYDDYVDLYLQNSHISITVKQFLQYYFYAIKGVQDKIQTSASSRQIDQLLSILYRNWQTMKNLNDEALLYYQASSQSQSRFLVQMAYFLYGLFLTILLILLLLVNQYYSYIERKKENIIRLHGFLTHNVCSQLRQIGEGIRQCLIKSYQELQTTLDIESLRQNKQRSQFRYEQNRKFNYYLALFFIIMAIFNSVILYQIATLFSPAAQMMTQLTSLIESENVALESYLQTKSLFLFGPSQHNTLDAMNQAMKIINTTEIQFATSVRNIQKTISIIGGQFADDFNQILIKDVCNLTRSLSSKMPMPSLLSNCEEQTNYNVLNLGAVASIDFIVRNVMKAMMKLMMNTTSHEIFFSSTFEDIDDYIYYLFDIFELLEKEIMNGMDSIAKNINSTIHIIIFFQISVLIIALFIWITRINQEKKNLSNLYAQVLQLPQVIFRENKIIMKILEENLTLKL